MGTLQIFRLVVLLMLVALLVWMLHPLWTLPLPKIASHYWRRNLFGAELYNEITHERSVSLVGANPGPAQVCVFESAMFPNPEGGTACRYFDSDKEASQWLADRYGSK